MKISVIVPIYNVENYLESCVNSIIKQTFNNIEIILVDDGSTDSSPSICDKLANKYQNIKVIHKRNGGLSSARNAGLDMSTGEYVGFVDSDDSIDPKMYEKLYKGMKKFGADIGICGRYYVLENGEKFQRYKASRELVMDSEKAIAEMNSFRSFDMAAWDKLYKKKLFKKIRFPENKLSEDYFIMYQIFDQAERIFYTPDPLYNYMQRNNSISHSKKINYDFIEASEKQMHFVDNKYPDMKYIVHTAYASANMTVFDFHLKSKIPIKKNIRKSLQKKVRENLVFVRKNSQLKSIKKIQAYLFAYNIYLYTLFFRIYKKYDKV